MKPKSRAERAMDLLQALQRINTINAKQPGAAVTMQGIAAHAIKEWIGTP